MNLRQFYFDSNFDFASNQFLLFADDENLYKKAQSFKKKCHEQANFIKKCPECFESWMNDKTKRQKAYFKLVCSKPHLIVLYKVKGYPIWPGKLFYVKDGLANVECFGDRTEDDIPLSQCFLYSNKFPRENSNDKTTQESLDRAYKVITFCNYFKTSTALVNVFLSLNFFRKLKSISNSSEENSEQSFLLHRK